MFYNILLQENPIPSSSDNTILIIEEDLNPEELEIINKSQQNLFISDHRNISEIIKKILEVDFLLLKVNQQITQEEILENLNNLGYKQSTDIIEKYSYQVRGNIIDIHSNTPVRIELEDNKIESIRIFNPENLLSIKKVNSAKIYSITTSARVINKELNILFLTLDEKEIIEPIINRELQKIVQHIKLNFKIEQITSRPSIQRIQTKYELIDVIKTYSDYKLIFSTQSVFENFSSFLIEYCRKKRIAIHEFNLDNYEILNIETIFGYVDHEKKQILITPRELKQEVIQTTTDIIEKINEFKEGDLVVVEGYGIGIYLGIQRLKISHYPEKDFIAIQFKNNRKILFSVESVSLHKYLSSDKITEKIRNKILSIPSFKSWQRKLEKVYQDVKSVGQKIIEINAERYSTKSPSLKPNPYDQIIEKSFQYILTEDQEKAIKEVLSDLERSFPSNRLILADTGYGKTEVIIRAITRSLSNNYKAILFVPTTILAYQHYVNIKKRLGMFRIGINTSIYKNCSIIDLLENKIDLLISTPFDLTKYKIEGDQVGLVVIDEEHLMGAIFKETLKGIFKTAHFIYSSATPIPRTYFMAKTGIIDISIINTPPPTYKQPKTFVLTFQDQNHKLLILEKIISKSLKSSLKVIYVNNDIDELYEKWYYFKNLGKSSIIHAKLNSKTIQKTFLEFLDGKIDIILSTTIIQSGIDTPEFDVVIIDNSHTLGISQIYQLRGRVGRGSKNPYCYILLKEDYVNTPTFDRISIFEREDLTNIDIVQRDLDIRGPGGILSKKQSGHIQEVGLIQFLKMINQHINQQENLPEIECDSPMFLPESPARNRLYRQLLTAKNLEDLETIKKEIMDIYGKKLPQPTVNLLKVIEYRIKNKGRKEKIKIKIVDGQIVEI